MKKLLIITLIILSGFGLKQLYLSKTANNTLLYGAQNQPINLLTKPTLEYVLFILALLDALMFAQHL